jgi:hypothetical protein
MAGFGHRPKVALNRACAAPMEEGANHPMYGLCPAGKAPRLYIDISCKPLNSSTISNATANPKDGAPQGMRSKEQGMIRPRTRSSTKLEPCRQ